MKKSTDNQTIKNYPKCPLCRKGQLRDRVPRSWFVKNILAFLPLKRYKCYNCGGRPYIFARKKQSIQNQ